MQSAVGLRNARNGLFARPLILQSRQISEPLATISTPAGLSYQFSGRTGRCFRRVNEREAHQKAAAAADGAYRVAIEPGKRDRNDRRNRGSPDSQERRKNESLLHPGGP
jgi:hypothetical protein